MFVNGIIIQKYVDNSYKGIDGSGFSENTGQNWFFNYDESESEYFEPYYDKNIGKTYWDLKEHTWIMLWGDENVLYIDEYHENDLFFC